MTKTKNKPSVIEAPPLSVIEAAKREESQSSLILIVNDRDAMKVIEAWRLSKPAFVDRPLKTGESVFCAIEEVWLACSPRYSFISDATGIAWNAVVHMVKRLGSARLIYPDGTAHKGVNAIISGEISAYLQSLLKPS